MSGFRITIRPDGATVESGPGETLMEVLRRGQIPLRSACGGTGVCGRCSVNVSKDGDPQPVLACQYVVESDIEVEVPGASRLEPWLRAQEGLPWYRPPEIRLPTPPESRAMVRLIELALPEPSPNDNVADRERLARALASRYPDAEISIRAPVARLLPRVLREAGWDVVLSLARTGRQQFTVTDIRPAARPPRPLALALDCGTTTIEAALLDLRTGTVVGHVASPNPQLVYGADVISRIVHAQHREGLLSLHRALRDAIRVLAEHALRAAQSTWQDLQIVLAAGNTTMLHLLHHVDPSNLRRDPYVPAFTSWEPIALAELGMTSAPGGVLMTLPSVSSYVGADIVAGLLATGAVDTTHPVGLVDLGTNGEIAVGCRDWVLCCASSAGPCFEGGGVTWGCPATAGAIHAVVASEEAGGHPAYKTMGGQPPVGICGSGVLDAVGTLFRAGAIDRRGKLDPDHAWVRASKSGGLEALIAPASEAAGGEDVILTAGDIDNVVKAKAAIFSGLETCLQAAGLAADKLEWLALAGGFGASLDVEKALAVGLLPPMEQDRVRPVGNSSITGVALALTDEDVWAKTASVARMMTTLELSTDAGYMDRYTAALFIPHTDVSRFNQNEAESAS
jgi:uncharacterized 2Fe-2S/4Fe-4S cluster protein (DUF4445 family)